MRALPQAEVEDLAAAHHDNSSIVTPKRRTSRLTFWRNPPLIMTPIGFVLGTLIGPIIEQWWVKSRLVTVTALAVLLFLILLSGLWALLVEGVEKVRREVEKHLNATQQDVQKAHNEAKDQWERTRAEVEFSLERTRAELDKARSELRGELQTRVGIKVSYHLAEERGVVYDAARDVIESAKKSILALNSYLVEFREPSESESLTVAREKYYTALLDRADHKIEYHRLLQVDKDNFKEYCETLAKDEPVLWQHLKEMESRNRLPRLHTALGQCDPTRLTNFVLVDEVYLIWQINEMHLDPTNKSERTKLQGAFIFHDPQKQITQHFELYFKHLLKNSNRCRLEGPIVMPNRTPRPRRNR